MSILLEVLQGEYDRILRTIAAYEQEAAELPKGHIAVKRINNGEYYYLQWHDGQKTRAKYIRQKNIEDLRLQIERRNYLISSLRRLRKSEKLVHKVLERELRFNPL
jgi:hypothetical protein